MPKRTDIKSILIIGAGPIVIGQACEFDYSGTQACKALKAEGYRIVLVNSNPATIMTDPELADATYIEPITPDVVAKIIAAERPDALLPTMGGQTALNTALALYNQGVLQKFGVELIGANAKAIYMAEDREQFKQAMARIGLETPRGETLQAALQEARDQDGNPILMEGNAKLELTPEGRLKALEIANRLGFPVVIRPSFTLGGQGGGVAFNREEFLSVVERGVDASPTNEVLVEESVLGWKEFEMEVVRDHADNCIIICSIENVDPMGVHTGDARTAGSAAASWPGRRAGTRADASAREVDSGRQLEALLQGPARLAGARGDAAPDEERLLGALADPEGEDGDRVVVQPREGQRPVVVGIQRHLLARRGVEEDSLVVALRDHVRAVGGEVGEAVRGQGEVPARPLDPRPAPGQSAQQRPVLGVDDDARGVAVDHRHRAGRRVPRDDPPGVEPVDGRTVHSGDLAARGVCAVGRGVVRRELSGVGREGHPRAVGAQPGDAGAVREELLLVGGYLGQSTDHVAARHLSTAGPAAARR